MVPPLKMPRCGAGDARLKTRQSWLKPKEVWPDDDEKSKKKSAGSWCGITAFSAGLCGGTKSGEAAETESGFADTTRADATDTDTDSCAGSNEPAGRESAPDERRAGAHYGEFEPRDLAGDGEGPHGRAGAGFEA